MDSAFPTWAWNEGLHIRCRFLRGPKHDDPYRALLQLRPLSVSAGAALGGGPTVAFVLLNQPLVARRRMASPQPQREASSHDSVIQTADGPTHGVRGRRSIAPASTSSATPFQQTTAHLLG